MPSDQLPASASAGSLALPEGMTLEDIAEGSIRFFNDDLCLSIPFKGNHFMSIETIKSLTPRDVIHLYEVSWHFPVNSTRNHHGIESLLDIRRSGRSTFMGRFTVLTCCVHLSDWLQQGLPTSIGCQREVHLLQGIARI